MKNKIFLVLPMIFALASCGIYKGEEIKLSDFKMQINKLFDKIPDTENCGEITSEIFSYTYPNGKKETTKEYKKYLWLDSKANLNYSVRTWNKHGEKNNFSYNFFGERKDKNIKIFEITKANNSEYREIIDYKYDKNKNETMIGQREMVQMLFSQTNLTILTTIYLNTFLDYLEFPSISTKCYISNSLGQTTYTIEDEGDPNDTSRSNYKESLSIVIYKDLIYKYHKEYEQKNLTGQIVNSGECTTYFETNSSKIDIPNEDDFLENYEN